MGKKILIQLYKGICGCINRIIFTKWKIQCTAFPEIKGFVLVKNFGRIEIGKNVRINSSSYTNPIGGDCRTSLATWYSGIIKIGNNVGISNCAIYSRELIEIEDNVLIGGSCKIYDTDFHPLNAESRNSDCQNDIVSKPVKICKNVFVGAHSIVLKGVTIGENSVVGAGSVVTKSVPNGEIWAGNPARFIKVIGN